MWLSVHIVSGMALASVLPRDYWVLIPSALVLHAALDTLPHWDYTHTPRGLVWLAGDLLVAAAIALVCLRAPAVPAHVAVAGIVSTAPDLDVVNGLVPWKRRVRFFPSHWERFPHGSLLAALIGEDANERLCEFGPGVALQAIVAGACGVLLALTL